MKLLIVSTAPLIYKDSSVYAYSPYVSEIDVWSRNSDEIAFCCPVWEKDNGLLVSEVTFKINSHFKLIDFNIKSYFNIFKGFFIGFYNIFILFKAMCWADHIHLRCPGNIGLLGVFVQIAFPNKSKTAKYAGNWDPTSKQPWSYRLQKWILSNTFLTRNIQVLVYGEWDGTSKNITSFFTASYKEVDKVPLVQKRLKGQIDFIFVGALVQGKNPLYAIQLVELLQNKGYNVYLDLYGEGLERNRLEEYIEINKLENNIVLKGNQSKEAIMTAYQQSHFVVLPSVSEGWPKAIAEGMFWGCLTLGTAVSCVPFMLDYGNRGILLEMNLEKDVLKLQAILNDQFIFDSMQEKAASWSRKYTVDVFEEEIKKLLQS
jgi:glycosyltransferase involved in cell wall biosynthesis